MKFFAVAAAGAALVSGVVARHSHQHDALHALHVRRHQHSKQEQPWGRDHPVQPTSSVAEAGLKRSPEIKKRTGTCEFPSDAGLIAVAPGQQNAGWALPPDQPCKCGDYCPYACPPGEMMAQWDPKATSYSYPASMNGGLYCNDDGTVSKPFKNKPYCMKGISNIGVKDNTGKGCAVCQTVLPGSESMLIPTAVDGWNKITVPGTDYWCETAAHFYINPPGVSTDEGCIWGTAAKPRGNWSPYVAGANTDGNGQTFLKIGWNPKYTDGSAEFDIVVPEWGIEIECDGDGCNGLPCAIDPKTHKVNEISGESSTGAGDAAFCVVTVPKGVSANIVVSGGGSGGGNTGGYPIKKPTHKKPPPPPPTTSTPEPTTSSTPEPTTSAEPTTSSTPEPEPTTTSTSETPTSTYVPPTTTSTPSSTEPSTTSTSSTYSPSSTKVYTTKKPSTYSKIKPPKKTWSPHAFNQNYTVSATGSSGSGYPSATTNGPTFTPSSTTQIASEPTTGAAGKVQLQAASLALGSLAVLAAIVL